MGVPIFVTRVKVGTGRDMVMISAESPAGDTSKGEVETLEAVRIVVSPTTFAEITELFVRTLKTLDLPHLRVPSAVTGGGADQIKQFGDIVSKKH
jgi:hypothetical protein